MLLISHPVRRVIRVRIGRDSHCVECSPQLLSVYRYTMSSVPYTKVSTVRRVALPLPEGKELPLFRR